MATPTKSLEETLASIQPNEPYRRIYPGQDIVVEIAREIEKETGAKPASFLDADVRDCKRLDVQLVSADPRYFVGSTLDAIRFFVGELKRQGAKRFQIAFENKSCGEKNLWNDHVYFGVRYLS